MKIKYFLLCYLSLIVLGSCNNGFQNEKNDNENAAFKMATVTDSNSVTNDQHNSSNSLGWNGIYKGVLPCADCEGIETEIILNPDSTFLMRTKYLGKAENAFEEKGDFSWGASGNTIVLARLQNKPNQYFVEENKIIQLDLSGNKITGKLADKYILIKQ